MDSSPDLSLKLRRGSSDSRETFYMDFAQGIDSDIEEVDTNIISDEPQITSTSPLTTTIADDEPIITGVSVEMTESIHSNTDTALVPAVETDEQLPSPPIYQTSYTVSSPTSSVLEIIPPPPLEMLEFQMEDNVYIDKECKLADNNSEQDQDDDETSSPPPALQPLPTNFSYVHTSALDSCLLATTSQTHSVSSPPTSPYPQQFLNKSISTKLSDSSSASIDDCSQDLPSPIKNPVSPPLECEVGPNSLIAQPTPSADCSSVLNDDNFLIGTSFQSHCDDDSTTITTPPSIGMSGSPLLTPTENVQQEYASSFKACTDEIEHEVCFFPDNIATEISENVNAKNEYQNRVEQICTPPRELSPVLSSVNLNSQSTNISYIEPSRHANIRKSSFDEPSSENSERAEVPNSGTMESENGDDLVKIDSPLASIASSKSSVSSIKCVLSKPTTPLASNKSPPDSKLALPFSEDTNNPLKITQEESLDEIGDSALEKLTVHEEPTSPTASIKTPSGNKLTLPLSEDANLPNQICQTPQIDKGDPSLEQSTANQESEQDLTPKIDLNNETSLTVDANLTNVPTSTTAANDVVNTVSFKDEHRHIRGKLEGQHHYRLPHHFQHPHHQNHHNHGVPVAMPTVPVSYTSSHVLKEASVWNSSIPMDTRAQKKVTTLESESHEDVVNSRVSARSRDSSQHRVTIADSKENILISSSSKLPECSGSSGGPSPSNSANLQFSFDELNKLDNLALMCHSGQIGKLPVVPALKRHRPSFIYPPMPRVKAGDALATLLSALYGKILVVMGIAFPMAEVISTYIPPSFYEAYYLYLYIGSMIFLLFMYATMLWGKPKIPTTLVSSQKSPIKSCSANHSDSLNETDTDSSASVHKGLPSIITTSRRPSLLSPLGRQHHYGSFYLRMGAVAFGIGSMIYSGLEFGQYFELNPDTKCHNVLLALTPATRMAFIFVQMYFIFLNNEQIKVYRYKIVARFGLMHMIGTNLAVWLNVLIQETKHEILTFYNPENRTLRISHRIPGHSRGHAIASQEFSTHVRIARGLKGPYQIFECRRTNIIGTLVQDASPFLFPCTIEYSLICAAILYVMWRSISRPNTSQHQRPESIPTPVKRSPHHYSVDCARAHKGLFVGILILVLTIISLILFFVLISRPDFVSLAVTEVTICELLIYGTATIATLVGMIQVRHLQYDAYRSFSLDDILLVGAQTGSFLYNIFTVIAGHFTIRSDDMLVPLNALASIVQTACQTMFILDASRRQAVTPEHIRKKPGREIVTFMLVVNLAMWAISTLEKSRAESHPIQLNFYGLWAWTIITHVSMPLAIFYRFHSTVCLCEIWKRAYKLKPAYM